MTTEKIRDIVLIALAADESLVETLVLKGGNAISLLERENKSGLSRSSKDLDFSIEYDFDENLEDVNARIERTLTVTFCEHGYSVFDYHFIVKPTTLNDLIKSFWGGYNISFKIIEKSKYDSLDRDMQNLRRKAIRNSPQSSPKIEIEISKYEFVAAKIPVKVDGFTIFIYSPEMIVFEKLRAICQQNPKYADVVQSHAPRPRARDFYDIVLICDLHSILPLTQSSTKLITTIFQAKNVPLEYLKEIRATSDIHRRNWQDVLDTISVKYDVRPFDYYLNFVVSNFGKIKVP